MPNHQSSLYPREEMAPSCIIALETVHPIVSAGKGYPNYGMQSRFYWPEANSKSMITVDLSLAVWSKTHHNAPVNGLSRETPGIQGENQIKLKIVPQYQSLSQLLGLSCLGWGLGEIPGYQ